MGSQWKTPDHHPSTTVFDSEELVCVVSHSANPSEQVSPVPSLSTHANMLARARRDAELQVLDLFLLSF